MSIIGILLIFPVLLYFLYKWSTKTFKTFEERGIPFKKPLPLLGNSWEILKSQQSLHKIMLNLYRETKQHKIYGLYNFRDPLFVVNDSALIKQMGIKDFDWFTNHQRVFNLDSDPILGSILTIMRDQRWKNMRNTITPIFTGAKMRTMYTLMNDCFAEAVKYAYAQFTNNSSGLVTGAGIDLETKEFFSRLSNDLIATTAFGLKINSYKDINNEFFQIGKAFTGQKRRQALKFILFTIAPKVFGALGLTLFDKEKTNYFVRLVIDAMKYREEHKIVRPDMIQLLLEAKQESVHQWSDDELVAQCFIFFFAAFENNASLLCTTCHELMENPEVQNKLYEEIKQMHDELNGKLMDYDNLKKMKYLDMVVSESLRKWTLSALTDRTCGKDYTVKDEDGQFICELKEGDRVWFQTIGLHWDPEYFEQPERFDPERFSDDNRPRIKPCTYLPFGVGPRICIGNRYALMQAKAMLYYLLIDFQLERSEKTCKNLLDDIRGFTIAPKNGFWIKFVARTKTKEL